VPDPNLAKNQVVAETLKIVSSSLLGLTVGCAQCHDHRYDPISHEDYFRMRAIFEPALDWKQWRPPAARLVSLLTAEQRAEAEAIEAKARAQDEEVNRVTKEIRDAVFEKRIVALPEELREPIRAARATPLAKRTEEQKKLFKEHPGLNVDAGSLAVFDPAGDKRVAEMRAEIAKLRATKPDVQVPVLDEITGELPDTFRFNRGDHEQPREKVAPGELTVVGFTDPANIPLKDPALPTSGRRLAYARHLTDGRHPLVARVLVNRFWLHHFGRGLVNTPGDFGTLGERPSHPELLDWLASQFMAGGWRLKPLHKLLVTSAVYRQSSRNDEAAAADPDNKFYARFKLQRLDAETFRDAMLAISGKLNPEPFGPPVPVALDAFGRVVSGVQKLNKNRDPIGTESVGDDAFRRSIYMQVRRRQPLTILETFDAPVMSPNCDARASTTGAPQSLLLMNDTVVVSMATDFAERLRREHPDDAPAQIRRAWRLLFAAEPTSDELRESEEFLAAETEILTARVTPAPAKKDAPAPPDPQLQALASLCQSLFSTSRFLYIE
jgi:hypothetical protein